MGWTRPSIHPIFFEKTLRFLVIIFAVFFSLTRKKMLFNLSLVLVIFYPLFFYLNPSCYSFLNTELNNLLSLKHFSRTHLFEPAILYIDVVQGSFAYFVSFGYYLSILGVFVGIINLQSLKFTIKASILFVVLGGILWFCVYATCALVDKNYSAGRNLYSLLGKLNSFSHVTDDYDYIYFKIGEFDAKRGKESWENKFYQALIYKENNQFELSLELFKQLIKKRKRLVELQLSDLIMKINASSLSESRKLFLLRNILILYQSPELEMYLACLYFQDKSYNNSISLAQDAIAHTKNKFILADLYSLLGDIYGATGDVKTSRQWYYKSLQVFNRIKSANMHALKGLAGW
jgi:hypothetical protein